MNTRLKFAAGLSLAAALTSFADVKVNEMLTISGYAVGSYEYTSPDPGADTDSLTTTPNHNTTFVMNTSMFAITRLES